MDARHPSAERAPAGDPEAIESAIENTRERIGEDVDAISYQLSPDRLKERAVSTLQNAQDAVVSTVTNVTNSVGEQAKQASSGVIDTLKRHPLPAALIGLGVGLLAAGSVSAARSSSDEGHRALPPARSRSDYPTTTDYQQSAGRSWQGPSEPVGASASSSYSSYTSGSTRRPAQGIARWMEDSPLSVGAVALLAGAAIGFMVPGTQYEDEVMGSTSDELIERAKSKVGDTVEVAKESAKQARDTLQNELSSRGVSADDAKQSAKERVKGVVSEAEDVVRKVTHDASETAKTEAEKRGLASRSANE